MRKSRGHASLTVLDVFAGLLLFASCSTTCHQDMNIAHDGLAIFVQCGWYGKEWCKEHTKPSKP